ncbi:MAG TPA: hypothetical protein VFH61_04090 [Thermoleophilia bacterium]|nr:hypothetical protein [Thermoleophilia bacterium]
MRLFRTRRLAVYFRSKRWQFERRQHWTAGSAGAPAAGSLEEQQIMALLGIATDKDARPPRLAYTSLFVGPWEFRFPARR